MSKFKVDDIIYIDHLFGSYELAIVVKIAAFPSALNNQVVAWCEEPNGFPFWLIDEGNTRLATEEEKQIFVQDRLNERK